jgi:4-amino-4-deoxy-L-arabinose transferase-like glycosyltransferase
LSQSSLSGTTRLQGRSFGRVTRTLRFRAAQGPAAYFTPVLVALSLLGLAGCLAYALAASPHEPLAGDALVYHYVASALVHGHGFSNGGLTLHGPFRPTAEHPPLFSLLLAGFDELGLTSFNSQRAALCLLGTAAVILTGLLGRRVAGPGVGLIAAAIAAVYPNLFMIDGMMLAESLYVPLIALVLLLAYRVIDRPSAGRSAALGVAIGLAALTRSEALLLVPLLALPIALRIRPGRLRVISACTAAALLVISPWLVRNWAVMDRFPLLSTNGALTSAAANCDYAYYHEVGFFSGPCAIDTPCVKLDEVHEASCLEHLARVYVVHHLRRVPVVVLAREGRAWDLYGQDRDLRYASLGGRDFTVGQAGLGMYLLLLPLAAIGIIGLRRRKLLVFPLLAPLGLVAIAAATTWGFSRYRAAAEVPLIVLAGAGIQALLTSRDRGKVLMTSSVAAFAGIAVAVVLLVTGNTGGSGASGAYFALPASACRVSASHITAPPSCRPLGILSRPSELRADAVRLADGRDLPITPDSISSFVEHSQVVAGRLEIDGWAANLGAHHPASAILVFVGGHFVGAVKPTVNRPDVARHFALAGVRQSGFQVILPPTVLNNGGLAAKLQLVGVGGDQATLLPFDCTKAVKQLGC